jgi:hypothetical protein
MKRNMRQQLKKAEDSSDSSSSSDSETEYETQSESEVEEKTRLCKKHKKLYKKYHKNKQQKKEKEDDEDDEENDKDYDEDDTDDENDEETQEINRKEYRKFISKMFPSKYAKKRAEDEEEDGDEDEEDDSDEDEEDDDSDEDEEDERKIKKEKKHKSKEKKNKKSKEKKKDKKRTKKSKKHNKKNKSESSTSRSTSESEDEEESEETTEDQKINIILSIGNEDEEDYEAYFGEEMEESEEEDCDTDDEQMFMKETYEKVDAPNEIKTTKKDKQKKKEEKKKKKEEKNEKNTNKPVEAEYKELLELKKDLSKKLETKPNNKILKNAIKECRESIHELVRDARKKNAKEYKELIANENTKPNEMDYFRKKLSNSEQLRIMKDMKEINKHINIDKPYRLALLQSDIHPKYKAFAMEKLNMLKSMEPCDNEYYKIKTWVDGFMRIPFCKNTNLSVKMSDGLEKCHEFMTNAKQVLDTCVYGLDDAKLQILQMLGQWITNPDAMGTAIAIKGPPGTGKTTLVKEGISKILSREFAFLPLGGATDSSFLEGHSYTYEGSNWGQIVQILMHCKCMNPVIYFDELDKISDTPKGEEITGILTHLTDTTQNSQFHDKYFSEIDFDLSKCLFIFSYNDESRVNPILKDRMYRIETKGYETKEKMVIARQYMLPKIREQVNFGPEDVVIPDDTLQYIITNKKLTQEEAGVRNMKRCLEIIHTKLNLFRLMKPEENMLTKEIGIKVEFPFTVLKQHVDQLIKNEEKQSQSLLSMYI